MKKEKKVYEITEIYDVTTDNYPICVSKSLRCNKKTKKLRQSDQTWVDNDVKRLRDKGIDTALCQMTTTGKREICLFRKRVGRESDNLTVDILEKIVLEEFCGVE